MGTHMKTTIEISDALLKAAKAAARAEGTTLRAIVERGLRATLQKRTAKAPFRLRDATVGGEGLSPAAARLSWDQLLGLSYEDRGG